MNTQAAIAMQDKKTGETADLWLTSRRCFLLIALLATICFANGLTGAFVQDDFLVVVNNTQVHSLGNIPRMFAMSYWGEGTETFGLYRPMTNVSHALTYALFGLVPVGYHLGNLALHALNGWLIFLIARRYTQQPLTALLTALVFTVHPVHVDAVSQIVGRTELLAAAFFFLAWFFYLDAETDRARRILSWLCFAGALFSKEHTLVLLGVIPLADLCARRGDWRTVARTWMKASLPYLAVVGGYLLIRFQTLGRLGIDLDETVFKHEPVSVRWLTMVDGFLGYFRLLVYPVHLCADYDFSLIPKVFSPGPATVLGLGLILLVIGVGAWGVFRAPVVGFGVLVFFVAVSIVSNLVVSTGILIAERALYLPSIGFCLLVGAAFSALYRHRPRLRVATLAVFCLYCGLMAWRDVVRNRDWADGPAFMNALLRDAPRNPKGWMMAGGLLSTPAEREAAFRKAVEVEPTRSVPSLNLGRFLLSQGRTPEAMEAFRQGYRIYSRSDAICLALATGSLRSGDEPAAFEWFARARALKPKKIEIYLEFGGELVRRGNPDKAFDVYRQALSIAPKDARPYDGLGLILLRLDRFPEAEQALAVGLSLDPESESLRANLGVALLAQGKVADARREFIRVLQKNPGSVSALRNLLLIERQRFPANEKIS